MSSVRHGVALALLVAAASPGEITVRRSEAPPPIAAWRAALKEGRPALRGFRAPLHGAEVVPIDLPADEPSRNAAAIVGKDLARDGLVATTVAALRALGVSDVEREGRTERLRAIGLPVDWLEFFGGASLVQRIAAGDDVTGAEFGFRPSLAGFAVATESGEHEIGLVRLQLASPAYYAGPGDGGALDVARQLVSALPTAEFFASVEEQHLARFLDVARTWKVADPARITIASEALPVSQWAQDDGKPGLAPAAGGSGLELVTLVPRYASRGEDGASFIPGETFLADGLAAAGHRVVQSPLLFQGGDLLAVRDPKSGERVLLVGEANVWRNTALGLTREQVLEAFRIEFGVDRCKLMPAISFHIDQEITVRAVGDRLVACVADPVDAVRIVLRCGLDALESAHVLTASQAADARARLDAGEDAEFLALVVPPIASRCHGFGRFPESLASSFARGPVDSGVANLEVFVLATDLLSSWALPVADLPFDPHSLAYLRSFQRRDADRRDMIADLRTSGFEVQRIPSLPEANRGIDYLNGVHDRRRYLLPAWGGLYARLDEAATAAFHRVLGEGVEIVPIFTSESQRRGGALHCSLSAGPRP
jgi:class 3 adenylate cyclase